LGLVPTKNNLAAFAKCSNHPSAIAAMAACKEVTARCLAASRYQLFFRYPPEQTVAARRYAGTRHMQGNIVITCHPRSYLRQQQAPRQ
jgi:hypothetical protein